MVMRSQWAADFHSRARSYWTPVRIRGQFGSKQLILPPDEHGPLLRAMGLLHADASMPPESVRKYMQISHMLTLLEPQLGDLAALHSPVRVLDLACGNSYLTLAMATSFQCRLRRPAQILGVDRNERLVLACRERAWRLGLDDILRFETGTLGVSDVSQLWHQAFGAVPEQIHLLVALHACDTATDEALCFGVEKRVPAMAVVPCCQAELAKYWSQLATAPSENAWAPIWSWPHLRRETAASMTDALRTLILRGCGYEAVPVEFVPSGHTPKNTMLRANLRNDGSAAAFFDYVRLRESLGGARLRLEQSLPAVHRARLEQAEKLLLPATPVSDAEATFVG